MEFSHDGKMENGKHILGKGEKRPVASAENIHRFNTQPVNEELHNNRESEKVIKNEVASGRKDQKTSPSTGNSIVKPDKKEYDAMDTFTRSYADLMQMNVRFNAQLIDILKDLRFTGAEKILDLIQNNCEAAGQLALSNTKEIGHWYNKHSDLALSFHSQFMNTIGIQSEAVRKMQNTGLELLNEWASDWWISTEKETKEK
ncbi:MAG TPA: hypothetical protein VNZ86_15120 [Bacteroidia bacterium]|nr:hypothetical protein [Bacteroidia bacterium]